MRELGSQIVYAVDSKFERIQFAQDELGIPEENCFANMDDFFAPGKLADALFICMRDSSAMPMP